MQERIIILSWYMTFSSEIPSLLTSKSKRRFFLNASGSFLRDHSNTYRLFQTSALPCKSLFSRNSKVPCVNPFNLLHSEQKITTTCMTYVFPEGENPAGLLWIQKNKTPPPPPSTVKNNVKNRCYLQFFRASVEYFTETSTSIYPENNTQNRITTIP